jgi:putative endonuclease
VAVKQMFWVYIIKSNSVNRYYIGHTANLKNRIEHHRSGREKYTKIASDWCLVFSKEYKTRTQAQKTENFIKRQKSRIFTEKVISGKINLENIPG